MHTELCQLSLNHRHQYIYSWLYRNKETKLIMRRGPHVHKSNHGSFAAVSSIEVVCSARVLSAVCTSGGAPNTEEPRGVERCSSPYPTMIKAFLNSESPVNRSTKVGRWLYMPITATMIVSPYVHFRYSTGT